MTITGQAHRPRHRCEPPVRALDIPAAPRGTVWRCPCGAHWIVRQPPLTRRGGMQRVPDFWHWASWWEVRRARRSGISRPKEGPPW